MLYTKSKMLFILIILTVITIFLSVFMLFKKEKQDQLALKTYRNTVALYCGNEVIKTYDEIVLNTLPEQDIRCFSNGIYINTIEEAEQYLTDYE